MATGFRLFRVKLECKLLIETSMAEFAVNVFPASYLL
jgi:hypothetical protein